MPFIPNELDAFHASQSSPDSGDFDVLRDGTKATGVVSGGAVTAQGTPDMTVAVATAVITVAGTKANVTAGNVTITTAHGTNPRIDLIVASSAGVKSAVAGTPAPEMAPGVRGPAFPAIPANSVVLASVYVPAADTTIAANQITDKRVFVVPPDPTTNYDLAKARSIPLVKERSQTVTLDTGEFQVHQLIKVGGRLFGVCLVSPSKLIRFNNLEDLTDRTVITFPSDGFHDQGFTLVYVAETNRIYVAFPHASRITVAEVNPDTMATTDVISDTGHAAGFAGNHGAMTSDGTHLYFITVTSPTNVVKYRLSDFAFVAQGTLTALNLGHSAMYDGQDIYVGSVTSPAWLAKVDPAALTFTSVTFPTGASIITHPGLASAGDYVWVAMEGGNNSLWRVSKVDLSLTSVPGMVDSCHAILYDGHWIWVTHDTNPGKITRVDPNDITNRSVQTFATGEDHAYAMASDGERIFVVFWDPNPAKVKRFVPDVGGSPWPGPAVAVRTLSNVADSNTGSSEQTLLTAAVGGILSADGVGFRVTASGWFAANANAKRILLKFGLGSPVTVFDTGSLLFNDTDWTLEAYCTRTGSNAQKWVTKWTSSSALLATKVQRATTTQIDTGLLNVNVRGVGVADADVTNEILLVETVN